MWLYVHTWFYATSLTLTVMMMNILIGILGNNYDHELEQSKALFTRQRAHVIFLLSAMPWYRNRIWRGVRGKYLWTASKSDGSGEQKEQERSIRTVVQVCGHAWRHVHRHSFKTCL